MDGLEDVIFLKLDVSKADILKEDLKAGMKVVDLKVRVLEIP